MSEQVVKRYSPDTNGVMRQWPDGDYANWADYDALHAEAEALRAENATLRQEQGERQEAVHWRALLHPDQRPQQPHDKHVVGFTTRESADAWVAEKRDFQGWDYSIEPLYTTPQPGPDVRGLVEAAQQADDVLSAIVRNDQPIETLKREYGDEWSTAIDAVRASLVTQIATHRQAQRQA